MSKYDDILSYLDDYDSTIAQLYRDLCIEHLFNPRNKPGITLLLPDRKNNAAVRKDFIAKSEGTDEEKIELAKSLAALVIYENMNSVDAFKAKSESVPNGLGQHIKVDLRASTSNTIKFREGCSAELDTKFRDATTKKNFNIYILRDGTISTTNDSVNKATTEGGTNRRRKVEETPVKQPSLFADSDPTEAAELRARIAKETENSYIMEQLQRGSSTGRKSMRRNVYAERVLSIINFIICCCSKPVIADIVVNKMLPLLSYENIDFYIFFEPYSDGTTPYLIPTDIIKRYDNYTEPMNIERTLAAVDKLYEVADSNVAVLSHRLDIQDAIDVLRSKITSVTDIRKLAEDICKVYADSVDNNKLGKIANLYPADISLNYKKSPFAKICQDEIRYLSHRLFESLETNVFDRDMFASILERISKYLVADPTVRTRRLLNPNTLKMAIQPQDKVNEIKSFVNSKYFMFCPLTLKETAELEQNYEVKPYPCIEGEGFWYPPDVRKQLVGSAKARSQTTESSGFISEQERAIGILRQLKASGQKIDQELLKSLTD